MGCQDWHGEYGKKGEPWKEAREINWVPCHGKQDIVRLNVGKGRIRNEFKTGADIRGNFTLGQLMEHSQLFQMPYSTLQYIF